MGACGLESGDVVLAAIPIRKMTIGIAQTLLLVIEWRIAMPKRTTGDRPELKTVSVGAAAIDIGSKMHMAAVNPACTDVPVRSFGTFTQHLHDLADWFKACGVTSVAMESTGIYWIPVYEILEQRGFDVILVNARYAKNVPGRKTDVSDAAWCASFIPTDCYAADLMPRLQLCAPICASASGWWNTPPPISSICRRR